MRNTSRAEGQRDRWRRQPAGRRKKDIGCESGGNMKEITQIWRGEAVETLTGRGAPSGTSPRASGVVARVMWCVEGGSSHERVTRGDEVGCTTAASFVQRGTGGPMFLPTLSGTDSMFPGRDAVKNVLSFTFLRMVDCLWVSDALRRQIL